MSELHGNWPSISSAVYYEDAAAAIDWLCEAFGFEVRLRIDGEGGRIEHSELIHGDGVVMVASTGGERDGVERTHIRSPKTLGGANTQSLCVSVHDVDAHQQRARAAGATIPRAARTDDYGEEYGAHRSYEAVDPEGHHWWFMRVVRDAKRA